MDLLVNSDGRLAAGGRRYRCALGRSGLSADKKEGDGATPTGRFALRRLLYRADRLTLPRCYLKAEAIAPDDGWCDDPGHPDYNCQVRLPHPASCEKLWREDNLYDVIFILGHNDAPPVPGKGSAIFMHVARVGFLPTEGCVALALDDLLDLTGRLTSSATLVIGVPSIG